MRRGAPSHTSNGAGYLLTRETMTYFHDHYMGGATQDGDWRASPLLAASLAALPPALVITAGFDPLRDEGMQYAARLTESGSRAVQVCFERQIHGFITMGRVLDDANTAVNLCAVELAWRCTGDNSAWGARGSGCSDGLTCNDFLFSGWKN